VRKTSPKFDFFPRISCISDILPALFLFLEQLKYLTELSSVLQIFFYVFNEIFGFRDVKDVSKH